MSNKTQEKHEKKTRSVLKDKHFAPVATLIVIGLSLLGFLAFYPAENTVKLGNKKIVIKVADTQAARERGLGGVNKLGDSSGMLFTFDSPDVHCFWMKDMNFPIDIVWLNENKKVVDIKENVAPESYPEAFCPKDESQYVLEVNAGLIDRSGVVLGSQL